MNVKEVAKVIVLVDASLHVSQHVSNNVQVIVVKVAKVVVNNCVRLTV